ncbi:MAG: putative DNA-binding proteinA [Syntrophomonadaceae bacterium]|nr:putative DNA-binding proteinA [Bacillota bacterium]MBT9148416.1 putative DNA-binding proteinA [Bacillota bacterium]
MVTKLLTPIEVAEVLKIDRITVYRWIKSGRIPAKRLPGGRCAQLRIRAEDVENLLGKREE